jgi:hypothetical protein
VAELDSLRATAWDNPAANLAAVRSFLRDVESGTKRTP